jgi:methylated-DNA-[protein]-cysteine S-methyltransferase
VWKKITGNTQKMTLSFTNKVKMVVERIPRGTVLTYKEVAHKAGNSKAARAVAAIMASNYDPHIPCHRVVRSDGGLGGYNRGGETKKRAILVSEGVIL